MKTCYPTLLLLLLGTIARAQTTPATGSVGIGTSTPDARAALDISSTDKGLLIPRLDSVQRAGIAAPPDGLMVFQTDGRQGFWYALGGQWLYIPDKTRAGDNLGNHAATQNLSLSDYDLRLRNPLDIYNGLGWYGNSRSAKNWLAQDIDGPVLYGFGGGGLGTYAAGTQTLALTWRSNGRVGLGEPNPNTRLSITPTVTEAKITLYDGGSLSNHYGFGVSGGQLNYHVDATVSSHVFYATGKNGTGTELMRIRGNGRVGIGTNDPQQALDVNGTARATNFAYDAAQTRYLTLTAADFISSATNAYDTNITIGSATGSPLMLNLLSGTAGQPGYVVAPVHLPQGATITSLALTALDNDGTSVAPQALLAAASNSTTSSSLFVSYTTQVALTTESSIWQTVTQPTSHVVRNDLYAYNLRVRLAQNSGATLVFCVRIGYTVAQPD
ncbi:hypothetical protein [Hymenobacter guriensis]|uniref:Uncharacterized protein n=1 Tax=Hymenobacter guriensis TaxID=2793065 RepID=A0ABS0KX40_9BACT|nr:hypothetical protein [Hymenobacter guriensis]MBG8551908.1 hypothetical protein [Hymenobacter guriensis]